MQKNKKIISSVYDEKSNKGINKKIKTAFTKNKNLPSVTLNDFFTEEFLKNINLKVSSLKFKHEKIADKHSYSQVKLPVNIFSQQFFDFIFTITDKKLKLISSQALKLSTKDYTLLHDNNRDSKHIIIIDLTSVWDNSWGGILYLTNDKGEHLFVPPHNNSLTIIRQKAGIKYFFKYVNNLANKERKLLILRFV